MFINRKARGRKTDPADIREMRRRFTPKTGQSKPKFPLFEKKA